jgi:hypothetical protein
MQQVDFGTGNLCGSEFESACRKFWLAYVVMETGEHIGEKWPTLVPANEHPLRILFAT